MYVCHHGNILDWSLPLYLNFMCCRLLTLLNGCKKHSKAQLWTGLQTWVETGELVGLHLAQVLCASVLFLLLAALCEAEVPRSP